MVRVISCEEVREEFAIVVNRINRRTEKTSLATKRRTAARSERTITANRKCRFSLHSDGAYVSIASDKANPSRLAVCTFYSALNSRDPTIHSETSAKKQQARRSVRGRSAPPSSHPSITPRSLPLLPPHRRARPLNLFCPISLASKNNAIHVGCRESRQRA